MPRRLLPSPDQKLPRVIKVEANLLRLPIFSLYGQELKTLDAIKCQGRVTHNGQTYQYTFEASRNVKRTYPGLLARSAHLALLSLMTDRGFPLENPISWSWRDLCRRMGIECSGQIAQRLKVAIRSTSGLLIHSQNALYSKPDNKPICTRDADLHLYDEVAFATERMPDGGVADTNYLWMSSWYLNNLNSFFTAPLDYELWRHLDRKSPTASRLYELLTLKFHRGMPELLVNYQNFIQLLPLRPERYDSDAKRQLDPAISHLIEAGVLDRDTGWVKNKGGVLQLHFCCGHRIACTSGQIPSEMTEDVQEVLEVKEIRNIKPPEWVMVSEFYKLWGDLPYFQPTPTELKQARALVQEHGESKAKALVPLAIKHMKTKWPEAKSFVAIRKYLGEAMKDFEREQLQREWERQERERLRQEREEHERQKQHEQEMASLWETLPAEERDVIEQSVLQDNPFLKKGRGWMMRALCLAELAKRRDAHQTA